MAKRLLVQLLSALACNPHLANLLDGTLYHGPLKRFCVPVLNCHSCPAAIGACPLGSLQGALSGRHPRFPAYALGLILLFGLIAGRFICGWLCPFGLVQELLYKLPLPKIIGKSPRTLLFSKLKYLWVLIFLVILPLSLWMSSGFGVPAFCKYLCPAGTLEGAIPLLLGNPLLRKAAGWITLWKFLLLIVFLVLIIVSYRPFCRWLCPLGAIYGLLNRYALLGVKVDAARCLHCGACARLCKMDTRIAGDRECISCGECLGKCPSKAIYFRKPFQKETKETKEASQQ